MEVTCTGQRTRVSWRIFAVDDKKNCSLQSRFTWYNVFFLPSTRQSCYYPLCPWSKEYSAPSSRILVIESAFFPDSTKLPELKIFQLVSSKTCHLILPEWSDPRRKGFPRHSALKNFSWRQRCCPEVLRPDRCGSCSPGWSCGHRAGWGDPRGRGIPGDQREIDQNDHLHLAFLR